MDYGHEQTDRELKKLERKITREYEKAYKEVKQKADDYFKQFQKKDADKKKLVDAGLMSKKDYLAWRQSAMLANKRWNDMADVLAKDLVNADKIAMSMLGEQLPDVYALNANYGTYEIEHGMGIDTSWTMYDHSTVENLMRENPQIIPKPKMDIPKDMRWNRQKIHSAITQGVLQGDSIPDIAKRLRRVTDMDRTAAIRNARTYTTAAENKGRIDSYQWAKELGIDLQKEWMATPDGRTRDSHVDLDGERVEVDGTFSNGCRYPADPMGDPAEVYNCRCTLVAAIKGRQYHDDRFTRLPEGMTYDDWKAHKLKGNGESKVSETQIEKTFAEKVHSIIDKAKQSEDGITTDTIREVGREFAKEVNGRIQKQKQELEQLKEPLLKAGKKELDGLSDERSAIRRNIFDIERGRKTPQDFGYSSVDEMIERRNNVEKRITEIKNSQEYRDAEKAYRAAANNYVQNRTSNMEYLKGKIAEVREVGIPEGYNMDKHIENPRSKQKKYIEQAYGVYPSDWVKKSFEGTIYLETAQRGYHIGSKKSSIIALSGNDDDEKLETAVHELAHRFEKVVQGLSKQEKEFYDIRTSGQKEIWMGEGYRRDEKTKPDRFVSIYMGRSNNYEYESFELASMGFQFAYYEPEVLAKDPDMQEWILGMLLTL